jgi:hypothetical protein
MTAPIPNCPQPETPIRERAWTDAQRWQMFRHYLATENDTFMNVFQDGMPSRPTEAQLDATCDAAINSAIAAEAQP